MTESTISGKETTTLLIVMGVLLLFTIAIVSANGGVHGIGRNHTGYLIQDMVMAIIMVMAMVKAMMETVMAMAMVMETSAKVTAMAMVMEIVA